MSRWSAPILVCLAVLGLIALGYTQRARYEIIGPGSIAPAYAATTLDGDTLGLESLRGRVVLLNVWATWCTPCRTEMPSLERLYTELHGRGLDVVAVSVDAPPGRIGAFGQAGARVAPFVAQLALTFPILLDPHGRVLDDFGVVGLPTTFIIDRRGIIRDKIVGGRIWDEGDAARRIRRLLED
ncbi:MAG: TlpA disulfide reductase family protein [Longimicrobiales bacterium]